MHSAIYKGSISHRRIGHAANAFRYSLFMLYLDLAEVDSLFDDYWFWSARRPALARFDRRHHHGPADVPLEQSIRDLVEERTGARPEGPIRLLTHLSYFGYCLNPLSIYYCYGLNDELQDIVLEVSNTPWGDQHCYVLGAGDNLSEHRHRYSFAKDFHVSPFMPLDMQYGCRLTPPGEQLYVGLDNYRDGAKVFGSHLALERKELNHRSMAATLARDPFMTFRVVALIHWQALKLWFKRAPYYGYIRRTGKNSKKEGVMHNG